jgi:hypothetical protein
MINIIYGIRQRGTKKDKRKNKKREP